MVEEGFQQRTCPRILSVSPGKGFNLGCLSLPSGELAECKIAHTTEKGCPEMGGRLYITIDRNLATKFLICYLD